MEMLFSLIVAAISGIGSGVGAYMAIRIEIAVMKHRQERADLDRKEMREYIDTQLHNLSVRVDDAHERIDTLTRSRMKTM